MQNLAKKKTTFSRDIPLMVIFSAEFCDEFRGVPWSSCTILQKAKRLFYKIFHLLVYPLLLLVNAESCKEENDFFARYSIY